MSIGWGLLSFVLSKVALWAEIGRGAFKNGCAREKRVQRTLYTRVKNSGSTPAARAQTPSPPALGHRH